MRLSFFIQDLKKSFINRNYIVREFEKKEEISAALDSAMDYFKDKPADAGRKVSGFYMLITYWDQLRRSKIGAIEAFKRLAQAFQLTNREASGLWLVAGRLKIDKKSEYFDSQVLFNVSFPRSTEEFTDTLIGDRPFSIIEIVAANLVTNFTHPLVHQLIEEFSKPQYDHFCVGSEEFRKYLKGKAKNVSKN
jgi:hypothetical protein